MQSQLHAPTHAILKTRVVCCTLKTLYEVLTHCFLIHWFCTLLITFLLLPSLNALSFHVQLFVYFISFIKLLLVFCVPITCNHWIAAQTTVPMKNHSASCTSYQSAYKPLQVSFLFVYEARNTAGDVCHIWSNMELVYRNV